MSTPKPSGGSRKITDSDQAVFHAPSSDSGSGTGGRAAFATTGAAWARGSESRKDWLHTLRVQVRLFGHFRRNLPPGSEGSSVWLTLKEGTTVLEALSLLGLPNCEPRSLIINHRAGKEARELIEGDVVAVFPPISGG
jgi:molybdopterin converting factor small subunit